MAFLETPGRITLAGAPEGCDALALAEIARSGRVVLHAARDDARLARLAEALAFFAPEVEILRFPAWDCLPYDRVSPNGEIAATRASTLSHLATEPAPAAGRIVIATVNALVQRVPPRAAFAGASFSAKAGGTLSLDALTAFLARNGYVRADTVREPGEFALRGGIVDLFPPGADEPVRLDLFGDQIERIRAFDPVTQRTSRNLESFSLGPVGEVFLDEELIRRFRTGYRELFGAASDDPLYAGISEGRRQIGMEHWLPLFHERLETLFDYLPDAVVTLDHQADAARDARIEAAEDYFDARKTFLETRGAGLEGQPVYRPLPPRMLYLDAAEWDRALRRHAVAILNPFAMPPGSGHRVVDLGARRMEPFASKAGAASPFESVREYFAREAQPGRRRVVAAYSAGSRDRLRNLLAEHGVPGLVAADSWQAAQAVPDESIALVVLGIEHGFATPGLIVVGEQDILGERIARAPRRRRRAEQILADATDLSPGDLVVHVEHGIGRYEGLETISVTGAPHDCFRLTYDGGDRLFVPVENIEVLSRYGSAEAGAALDRLGGHAWQARKSRLKRRLRDMAEALIKVAAERALHTAPVIAAPPGTYDEFCARFPYAETDDQIQAIDDAMADLAAGRPMDRLVCGDVGFGKTEVALRAAFATVIAGGQVAVVVPTTLLARQHAETFARRFTGFGIRIGQLSRLVAPKDAAETKTGLADGSVHVVIGTHALLAKDIKFRNLTLLVVDEEQHFGVKHKERLKQLRADVHVLTLTATPIPRTLQLALSGVREMSVIATPPVDRLAVRTFVLPYDPVVVREAILRERFRGGQIFYVCPRIEDLDGVAATLRDLVPEASVVMAHGRLGARALEDVMAQFYSGEKDILLSTQIVEFGPRHPNRQHDDRAPCRHVRPRPASPAPRADRPFEAARLLLPHTAAEACADRNRRAPTPRAADARLARRRVHSCLARPRHSRGWQPARRGAVGPYPRGRRRALSAHARGSGRDGEGRQGRGRGLDAADQPWHPGADPRSLCDRPRRPAGALSPPRRGRGPCRNRVVRRRADRPVRPGARRGGEPAADRDAQASLPCRGGRAARYRPQGRGSGVPRQPLRQPCRPCSAHPARQGPGDPAPRPSPRLPPRMARRQDAARRHDAADGRPRRARGGGRARDGVVRTRASGKYSSHPTGCSASWLASSKTWWNTSGSWAPETA